MGPSLALCGSIRVAPHLYLLVCFLDLVRRFCLGIISPLSNSFETGQVRQEIWDEFLQLHEAFYLRSNAKTL